MPAIQALHILHTVNANHDSIEKDLARSGSTGDLGVVTESAALL